MFANWYAELNIFSSATFPPVSEGRGSAQVGPKGGFWLDDSQKEFFLGFHIFINNIQWWRRSAAPERVMTVLAYCTKMLWSTGFVTDTYEHRRTTRLIHLRHRSFRRRAVLIPSEII